MARFMPYTGSVMWTDGSSGSVDFETEEGLKRWLRDLDVSHTRRLIVVQNPMIIGQTYDLEVKYQK